MAGAGGSPENWKLIPKALELRSSLRATEMCDLKWLLNALTLSTKALKEFEMLND